ncbi:hypothetical protein DPX16_20443 [Anabarilius grahami]|uniref:Uncharacterized protein n=1 Tax=Anabarilius grahami TaxID=495550 RepID=A0A3N0Z4W6_ANAGA|nr:hypothetical protein DPX16_20443 [Anabarilius grahami]
MYSTWLMIEIHSGPSSSSNILHFSFCQPDPDAAFVPPAFESERLFVSSTAHVGLLSPDTHQAISLPLSSTLAFLCSLSPSLSYTITGLTLDIHIFLGVLCLERSAHTQCLRALLCVCLLFTLFSFGTLPEGRAVCISAWWFWSLFVLRLNGGCIIGLVDELVGKFEKVLVSLNFPGAGESDRMTMTFVFDVIASGGERSSGWCMRAAVCLGRASRRAPGERVKKGAPRGRLDERFLSVH